MNGRELREHLTSGRRVYGLCVEGLGNPRWPRALACFGLDFVFLDNEHNPLNREATAWVAQAYAANGVCSLVRIPEPSAIQAAMAIDGGAQGIIVPYVETVEQVRTVVGAVKYRPLKGAALERAMTTSEFPSPQTQAYLASFNSNAIVVIMIESAAGVARLPDLLATGGVDGVLVGPHDFSVSHGIPEQTGHPVFQAALERVIRICQERHVGVGIHYVAGPTERERQFIDRGCNLIVHKSDTALVLEGIANEIWGLRGALGDGHPPQGFPWPFGPSRMGNGNDSW